MQQIVFEEPYRFIPPVRGRFWPNVLQHVVRPILWRSYGVESVEYRGLEHYRRAVAAGHGILLAANHCRPEDPLVIGTLVKETGQMMYAMASWHVFKQTFMQAWMVRRLQPGLPGHRAGREKQLSLLKRTIRRSSLKARRKPRPGRMQRSLPALRSARGCWPQPTLK